MRLNDEISEQEYRTKKSDLIMEKSKYEELISDSNQRIETWLDRADSLFTFAESAKTEFKNGSPEKKRQILSCIGSNLILENRNLIVKDNKKIAILYNLAPEVRTTHARLEPVQSNANKGMIEKKYSQNQKVGPLLDTFRTQIIELNTQNFAYNSQIDVKKIFQTKDSNITRKLKAP